jgi:hypothetical protein
VEVRAIAIRVTNAIQIYWPIIRIIGMFSLMQLSTAFKQSGALPPPSCDDCRIPASFKTEVLDARLRRQVRVYQCLNCAKLIWEGE